MTVSGFSKDTSAATSELAMVVSRNSKDLVEIIKELDDYFLMAADAGAHLSLLLEVPSPTFPNHSTSGKVYNCGRSLSPLTWTWGSNSKLNGFGKLGEEVIGVDMASGGIISTSHCCTAERLYAWEKKLYMEVKNAEMTKKEHEKRVAQLRKLEIWIHFLARLNGSIIVICDCVCELGRNQQTPSSPATRLLGG